MVHCQRGFTALEDGGYERAMEFGGEHGFDFVELLMDLYPGKELSREADRVRRLAGEHDLDIIVHLPFGDSDNMLASSDEEKRQESLDRMRSAVECACDIDAEKAVAHLDSSETLLLSEAGQFGVLCEIVDDLASTADAGGIELCIENMRGAQRRRLSPRDVLEIADNTAASVTLDTGHARTMGYDNEDIATILASHADLVSHIHLNDTRVAKDEHLPFGAGTVDFVSLFRALPDDWRGTLTLEITTGDYEYIAFSQQKLEKCLDTVL